jgi:Tfp pilus assembly protein PilP
VSVITERNGGVTCAGTGKKCLIVDQVMLKGVVRSQNESIAVVSSTANKTYFLRENDPVYNGVVVKITPDSIIFRESVTDRLGKTVQREVVKKVNNSAA